MDTFKAHGQQLACAMLFIIAAALCPDLTHAQSNIGGIINIYTPVLQITTDACAALLEVEDTTGFRAGDRVLLHQTMGCTGASDYTVDAVGLFEFATIERIRPNKIIELKRTLVHSYQRCNFVQLVRVPSYIGATTVTTPLRGKPWDGKGGGIIALEVRGVLNLRNTIDASSIGYQGGAIRNSNNGQCSTTIANTTIASPDAAMKGGTFVYPRVDNVAGNVELLSAGGGGVGHNSGGGGGGNGGRGGNGGSQWQGCGAPFDNGGRGGASLAIQFNGLPYMRFGGGGGAGHTNNNTGTPGGNGGGIIIIKADTIYGNQNVIQSLGGNAQTSGNDGAGGAGAGGCVLISSALLVGPLNINVNGGKGGDMSSGGLHGPGGGGGGGGVLLSGTALPSGVTFTAEGGISGRCTAFTDAVVAAHLAKPGEPGSIAFRAVIPENSTPKPILKVTILQDTTICPGQSATLTLRTIGSVAGIEWSELGGKVLSRSSVLDVKPTRTTSYVVAISDPTGCSALDTATVTVLDQWKGLARPLDLGDVFCDQVIDTSFTVVNAGSVSGFVSKVTFTSANVQLLDTLPTRLLPNDSVRIRVRVSIGAASGPNFVTVATTLSPCDSTITSTIVWNRQNRLNSLFPSTITMPLLYSCKGEVRDTTVLCVLRGSDGILTNIITSGSATSTTVLPIAVQDGTVFPINLQWSPSPGKSKGRVGLVLQFEGCYDTLWVDIDGPVFMPRVQLPDTVQVPDVLLCQNQPITVDVPITSLDSTTWFVSDVSAPAEVSLDLQNGDSVRATRVVRVGISPTVLGKFAYTVSITLSPCDTTIRLTLVGKAIDAGIAHVDTLRYTEPIIGRKELRTAYFVNRGDIPIDVLTVEPLSPKPFVLISSEPTIPCSLGPGDTLSCDIQLTQQYGMSIDSYAIITSNPCKQREVVLLVSEAYATNTLYMPRIESEIGATVLVPVLLDGRPAIDSSLLDSFAVQIHVQSSDLAVQTGSNSYAAWECDSHDSLTTISITGEWLGGDTLAILPMQTLLSTSSSTPLTFDRQPGFAWINQQCDVVYRDGEVLLGDVCTGRVIRLVRIGQTRPIVVYPNPTDDVAIVDVSKDMFKNGYTVVVVDGIGNVVQTAVAQGSNSIDLSSVPSGLYFVCVGDKFRTVYQPLIKR